MISHQTSSTGTDRCGVCVGVGSLCDAAAMIETTAPRTARPVGRKIGFSICHALLLASTGASIASFVSGRKELAICAGRESPAIEVLRIAVNNRQTTEIDYR